MRKKIYIGILLLGILAIGGIGGLVYQESQMKEKISQIENIETENTEQKSIENETVVISSKVYMLVYNVLNSCSIRIFDIVGRQLGFTLKKNVKSNYLFSVFGSSVC